MACPFAQGIQVVHVMLWAPGVACCKRYQAWLLDMVFGEEPGMLLIRLLEGSENDNASGQRYCGWVQGKLRGVVRGQKHLHEEALDRVAATCAWICIFSTQCRPANF